MAIDPVVIRFAAQGLSEVTGAFAQVSTQVRKFEEQAARESQKGAQARIQSTRSVVDDSARAHAKLTREAAKLERERTRNAEREAKQRAAAEKKANDAAAREAKKAGQAEEKEAKRVAREVERLEEYKMRVRIRSSEMAGRAAARQAAEEIREAERAAKARGAAGRAFGGRISKSVGGLLSGAGMLAGATLGLGGGMMLANAAHAELSAQQTAALLVNTGTSGGVSPGTVQDALSRASAESKATGVDKGTLLGAALKYSQNAQGGDFNGALANMGFFAKLSKASGADINEIAESAGTLQSQNAALGKDPAAMQQFMLNALAQSRAGKMSFADAAKQIGTLGSTRSYFTQDEGQTQLSLVGMGQIARSAGDVGEAGTFVKDLATEVGSANRKYKKKHGKDLVTVDDHGMMSSPEQMVAEVFRGTKGNIAEIGELFGKRGTALFGELQKSYLTGEKTGGVEGGVASAMAAIKSVSGQTMTSAELDRENAVIDNTPTEKFHMALNRLAETVEERLEPKLEQWADKMPELIPKLEAIIDAAGQFADWFLDNPIKGVGAIVVASVAKDMAAAGLKTVLENFTGKIAEAAGGVTSKGGMLTGALAAAAVAIMATKALIDSDLAEKNAKSDAGRAANTGGVNTASALLGKVRSGKVTAADIAAAQQEAAKLQNQVAEQKQNAAAGGQTGLEKVVNVAAYATGQTKAAEEMQRLAQKNANDELKNTVNALKMLQDAIKQASSAMPAIKSGAPTAPITDRAH